MAKLQLTISSNYVSDWGVYEGVREILQNALDGQQDGFPMTVQHANGVLRVVNQGAHLDRSVWLLGTTSKAGGDYRGHFGEGLKLGSLALARAGRKVRFVNGSETWAISLQPSEVFGEPVLTVSTRAAVAPSGLGDCFAVEVAITRDEWERYRRNFRELQPTGKAIETGEAVILLDPEQRGRCYVKGIFVEEKEGLTAGYDFLCASTDRDRRMIYGWDFSYYTAWAWANAFEQGHVTAERLLELLMAPTPDIEGMGQRSLPIELIKALTAAFSAAFGQHAVPVRSLAEQTEAGHLGRVGIVTSEALCSLFCNCDGLSLEKLRGECRGEVLNTYSPDQLEPRERSIRVLGTVLVEAAATPMGYQPLDGRLEIVDFRSGDILGTSQRDGDTGVHRIRVARRCLGSLEEYIRVLVHELAHDRGGDGDVRHERAEGELFCRIIGRSLDGFVPRELRQSKTLVAA